MYSGIRAAHRILGTPTTTRVMPLDRGDAVTSP
jgi:hypothetical protein